MTVENLHDAIGQLPSDLIAKVDKKRSCKTRTIPLKRYTAMAACLALILCGTFFFMRLLGSKDATVQMAAAPAEAAPAAMAPEIGAEEEAAMDSAKITASPEPTEANAAGTGSSNSVCGLPTAPAEDIYAESTILHLDFPINISATQYAETRDSSAINHSSAPEIKLIRSQEELDGYTQKHSDYDLEEFSACCEVYDDAWFETHDLLIVLMKDLPADSSTQVTSMLDLDDNGIWELCISYNIPYEDTAQRTDRFVLMEAKKDVITSEEAIVIVLE